MLEWNKAFRAEVGQFLDDAQCFYACTQKALSVKLIDQLSSFLSSQSPNCEEYPFEQLRCAIMECRNEPKELQLLLNGLVCILKHCYCLNNSSRDDPAFGMLLSHYYPKLVEDMTTFFFSVPRRSFNEVVPIVELLFRVVSYGRIFSEMSKGAQSQIVFYYLDSAFLEMQSNEKPILSEGWLFSLFVIISEKSINRTNISGVLLSNKKFVKKRIFHILKQHSKCESERLSLSGFAKGMLLRLVWHLDNAIRAKDKEERIEQGFEEYKRILKEEYDEKKSMSYLDGLYFSRSPYVEDEEAFGDVVFDTACDTLCCLRGCIYGDGKECTCFSNDEVRKGVGRKWGKVWCAVHRMMNETAMRMLEVCCFGKKYLGERRDITDDAGKLMGLKRKRRSRLLTLFNDDEVVRSIMSAVHSSQRRSVDKLALKLLTSIIRAGRNEGRSRARAMLSGVLSTICELLMRGKDGREYKYRIWLHFVGDMIQTTITRPWAKLKTLNGYFGKVSPVFFYADILALREMLEEEGFGDLLVAVTIAIFVTLSCGKTYELFNHNILSIAGTNGDFNGKLVWLYFYRGRATYHKWTFDVSTLSDSSSFSELEGGNVESDTSTDPYWYEHFTTSDSSEAGNESEEIRWVQTPHGLWKMKKDEVVPLFEFNYTSRFFGRKRKYQSKHKWRRVQTNRRRKRNKGKVLMLLKKEEGFRERRRKGKQRRDDAKFELRTEMWERALHELSEDEYLDEEWECSEKNEEDEKEEENENKENSYRI
eukprot:MONOS_1493.1-p1 / transcript=MONOS_1493.1 / gene=MONOS_1493 / organism=Monocercomonoides_exilis_PA203 / gene_product=unspecified product / transcript_product=unspecified product / location=Mono_scaffold00026:162888-165361(-) / protein_length=761 / sequence_SO=supercontig / SO=protein_coding / is_pseudo=false